MQPWYPDKVTPEQNTNNNVYFLEHMTPERQIAAFTGLPIDEQVRIFESPTCPAELKRSLLQRMPEDARVNLINALAAHGQDTTTLINTSSAPSLTPEAMDAVRVIQQGHIRSFTNQNTQVNVDTQTRTVTVALNTANSDPTDDVIMTVRQDGRTQIVANGQNVTLQTLPNAQRVTTLGEALLKLDPQNMDLTALSDIALRNANMVAPAPSLGRDVYTA